MRSLDETRAFKGTLMTPHQVVDDPVIKMIEDKVAAIDKKIDEGAESDIIKEMRKELLQLKMSTVKWEREHEKRRLKAYLKGHQRFHHGRDINNDPVWFEL